MGYFFQRISKIFIRNQPLSHINELRICIFLDSCVFLLLMLLLHLNYLFLIFDSSKSL